MEEMNGNAEPGGSTSPDPVKVNEVATTTEPGRTLDPSVIGRRVEQEVVALLEEARADVDRKALACIRMVEKEVTALQHALQGQVASTLAQLAELAERIEPKRPAEPPRSLAERFNRTGEPATT
jgi:hypothetical protein